MILYFHDILGQPLDEFDQISHRISVEDFSAFLSQLHLSKKREWLDFDEYLRRLRANTLSPEAICLSFDDAALGVEQNGLRLIEAYSKQVALMVPSSPYIEEDASPLPHQWVEGVFRFKQWPVSEFKKVKKELKKRARLQGILAYDDWLRKQGVERDELFSYMKNMERFQFISTASLNKIKTKHVLCRHGHYHLPLGMNKDGPVLLDQLRSLPCLRTDYYALPFGDLIGELPLELKNLNWVFGTEGPYQGSSVVPRVKAYQLGEEFL